VAVRGFCEPFTHQVRVSVRLSGEVRAYRALHCVLRAYRALHCVLLAPELEPGSDASRAPGYVDELGS